MVILSELRPCDISDSLTTSSAEKAPKRQEPDVGYANRWFRGNEHEIETTERKVKLIRFMLPGERFNSVRSSNQHRQVKSQDKLAPLN